MQFRYPLCADDLNGVREQCESMSNLCKEWEDVVSNPAFDDDKKYEILAAFMS